MIIGDYTTHFTGGYSNPIEESLLTNQYNGMIEGFGNCSIQLGPQRSRQHSTSPRRKDSKSSVARPCSRWGIRGKRFDNNHNGVVHGFYLQMFNGSIHYMITYDTCVYIYIIYIYIHTYYTYIQRFQFVTRNSRSWNSHWTGAGLFLYRPYQHGLENFWNIWLSWNLSWDY